ncbi:MAG: dockerin type I domain-containing protein [Bacillota bacterium]
MSKKAFRLFIVAALLIAFTSTYMFVPQASAAPQSVPYKWKNVQIGAGGGFVPGIIFNTKEKDLIYARTDMGGAYRWNPSNGTWIPLTDWVSPDEWNLLGIESMATDPVDPDRLYIAAGTYTNSWTSMNGYILRSTDRGNTFERTEMPFKFGGNMPGRSMGERMAIDPNKNSILYFGARSGNGLWRSTDYGVTWSKVANFPNVGPYVENPAYDYTKDPIGVVWVTFDQRSSTFGNATKTIYVGVADNTGDCIYRSTDAGATWEAVPGQPVGFLPHHGILSSDGMLYISYSNGAGPYDGTKGDVWKFNTATGAWTNISPIPSSSTDNYFGYGGLAVDAQKPGTIMVATLNSWWPDAIIFRSTDGGATWTRIWDWAAYPTRSFRYNHDISTAPWLDWGGVATPPEVKPKLGWMIGDLEIDPFNSDRMMYGTGATIYGSDNLTNWDKNIKFDITVKGMGIEETAVLGLVSPPEGAPLVSVMGDICGFRHDDLNVGPAKFHVSAYGTTTGIDFAELKPNFMAITASSNESTTKRISFSYDGGTNWFQASTEPANASGGGLVAAAADATSVVWAPKDAPVACTTNDGSSWTTSTGIPQNAFIASDRVNGKKFYGLSGGKFYLSTDGGTSFTATSAAGLPTSGKIKAVPGKEGDVWLAGGTGGLMRSTNSGTTFTKLPNVTEADTVGFGKAAPGKNYMAVYITGRVDGVYGVFRSDDTGASWVRVNDDQHQYGSINYSITGDPRVYGRVYVATNGRGIVYGEPDSSVPVPTPSNIPNPTPTTKPMVGDVNGDGVVNSTDYTLVKRYALRIINDFPVTDDLWAGDVNGDGLINSTDLTLVKRFILKIITEFPKK